jgi:hypothetical protein
LALSLNIPHGYFWKNPLFIPGSFSPKISSYQEHKKEIQKKNSDDKRGYLLKAEYDEAQTELSALQALDQKIAEVSNPRTEPTN